MSNSEPIGHAALVLAQMILVELVGKNVIPLERAKDLLLNVSALLNSEAAQAGKDKKQQAAVAHEVEETLMSTLDLLETTFGRRNA